MVKTAEVERLVGYNLGSYKIIEKIGQSDIACVYKARQLRLNQVVAIKVLRPKRIVDPNFHQTFQHKAQTLTHLDHPHILPIYDFGFEPPYYYLVMPYIPHSKTLATLMRQFDRLDELLDYLLQIATALQYLHEQQLIHQDVKPTNIFIDQTHAFLGDFDLIVDRQLPAMTLAPASSSPTYMSPEQRRGQPLDQRTDIYALGLILYRLLASRIPPAANRRTLVRVAARALSVESAQRYASATEFAGALQAARGGR